MATESTASAVTLERVIISFRRRIGHDEARKVVYDALNNVDSAAHSEWWKVERRRTPGPSDFAVVDMRLTMPLQRTRALTALRKLEAVRALAPERRYELPATAAADGVADDAGTAPSQCSVRNCSSREAGAALDGSGDEACAAHAKVVPASRRPLFTAKKTATSPAGQSGVADKHAPQVTSRLHAEALWRLGYTGKGVHVAVFDTGLGYGLPQLTNVEERTNWTDEEDSDDKVGLARRR